MTATVCFRRLSRVIPSGIAQLLIEGAERAALDYVTELTTEKKVDQSTFERLARYYSDREICEIVWLIASEHFYNMTNIGLNIHSDMLCDISRKSEPAAH